MHRILLSLFVLALAMPARAQEICNNGIDDDGNGMIDLNDSTACTCSNLAAGATESLIPNPSFEDHLCLPTSWSQLNCADGWFQATDATSDYFNANGYLPNSVPAPIPDGDGLAGLIIMPDWQEYLGACLLSPMVTGEQYSINFNISAEAPDGIFSSTIPIYFGPIEITIFGLPNCVSFPVNTTTCPEANGWVPLGTTLYTPENSWSLQNITFTPTFDVAAVMLGSPCILPADYQGQNGHIPYFFIDNLLLAEDIPYDASIAPLGGWCTNDLVLEATPDSLSGDYQWYQEGVALLGETGLTLAISANALPPATYQFRYQLNDTICVTVPYEVTIPPEPHPSFTVSSPVGCAPHTTTLTSTTAGVTVASCAWDFGIGTSTGTCDTTITYDTPGTYDITLTVTSAEGCVGDTTVVGAVQVVAPPTAAFTPDVTQGCEPLTVNFTNASVGDWTDCAWDFGDGSTAIGCDPTYTFPAAGLFSVSLMISTGGVCGNDTIMDALIEVLPSPVLVPTVDADAGCRPHTASFSQNVPLGSNLSCVWTFGNGQTSSDCAASTTYTAAGLYSVSLSATSANGCVSDTVLTDWITVYDLPQPDLSADAQAGCPPFLVNFTNTTPPGQSAACAWDFGDGGTSAICAPAYTYTQPGTYAVSLTVTSPQGCVADTLFDPYITVYQPPLASFESAVPSQCYSFPFDFTNTSTGSVGCSWAFGDGATSTDCDPQHTYAEAGLYDVTLTVTSAEGCVDDTTAIAYIDAIAEPVPIIGSDTTQGCESLTIQFQNLTDPASVASCAWTFGNGDVSTDCDPEYTYAEWGTYTVSLTVTAPWGCVNDTVLVDYITAWDRPDPDILAEPRIGCPPLQVDFTNATPAGQTAFTAWNFGDGTVSPESDPSHLYLHSGTYNVSLTVVSPMGCWGDSLFSEYITVLPKPQADFTYTTTGGDIFWPRFDLFDASSPDVVSWWWSFGEGGRFGTDSVPNTSIIFPEEVATTYPIMLIVADTNQCMDTTVRYITVEDVLTLYVPNSFTPNADDVNELFLPILRGPEPAAYLLSIYDRWGQLQFTSTDPDEGWDGSLGGAPAKEDVYVWQLEFSFVGRNESDRRIGHVTLLR